MKTKRMKPRWFSEPEDPNTIDGPVGLILLVAEMILFTLCTYGIKEWGATEEEYNDYYQYRNTVVELKVTRLISPGEGDYRIIGKTKTGEYYSKKVDLRTFSTYEVGDIIKDKYTKKEINELRKKSGYGPKYDAPIDQTSFAVGTLIAVGISSLFLIILVLIRIDWKRPKIILILGIIAVSALWMRCVMICCSAILVGP